MLFTQKYAPRKLNQILGNEDRINYIQQWITNWISNNVKKPLLICGPSGVGKTSIAYAIATEFDLDLIELNASEIRNKSKVEQKLGPKGVSLDLFGRRRLFLIDDADILASRSDSGGSAAISSFLKECIAPIIVTATDPWDKKLSSIRFECELIELKKINKLSIKKLIEKISIEEKIQINSDLINAISENSSGDVRAAINDLQAKCPSKRERDKDIFNTIRDIFKSESYSAVKEILKGDIDYELIKLWVDENIPLEYESLSDISLSYQLLSLGDVFDGRIRKNYWQLLKYSIDLSTAGVALSKKSVYRKFTKYSFPTYLKNMSKTMEKRSLLKKIGQKIGRIVHTNKRSSILYIPIFTHMAKSIDMSFLFEEDELAFILGTSIKKIKG